MKSFLFFLDIATYEKILFKKEKEAGWRKDSEVGSLELSFSHENTKITNNCWTTIKKKNWNYERRYSTSKDKKRNHNNMIGGVLLLLLSCFSRVRLCATP